MTKLSSANLPTTASVWLVTGAAGFIGSNIIEQLLMLNQTVIGLDNLSTGFIVNLEEVEQAVGKDRWSKFRFIRGSIEDAALCNTACRGVDFVLHQAALGSVPWSINDPLSTHNINVNGFLNILIACRDNGVKRLVYASSSAVYGDNPSQPKKESDLGNQLSPYALSKLINEQYAAIFNRCFGVDAIGLRYFNVFGPRQSKDGAYAAVIPKWITTCISGGRCAINGTDEISRDFCFVKNVVEANLLAATTPDVKAIAQAFNIGFGQQVTLGECFREIRTELNSRCPSLNIPDPEYAAARPGDIQYSVADIFKAVDILKYVPKYSFREGIKSTIGWYLEKSKRNN